MSSPPPATNQPRCRARVCIRRIWLRGYLIPLLLLVLWLFSTGAWVLWLSNSPPEARACLGRGVILVNWNSTATWQGFGTSKWNLGTGLTVKGVRVHWYVDRTFWSLTRALTTDFVVVIKPGHVQVPVIYLALLAAIPPTIAWQRRRRIEPWRCLGCRYDLRNNTSPRCPECGRVLSPGHAREH